MSASEVDPKQRRQAMTEAGWIVRDAVARAVKEYDLSHAELTAIIAQELSDWTKQQLAQDWGEQ